MTSISALEKIYKKGFYGNYEDKNVNDIIVISEKKNLLIVQIVKYKKTTISINDIKIENLTLPNQALKVNCNDTTRILWCGPNNWLFVSTNKELIKDINKLFKGSDFAVTDLSHSRVIIELEGKKSKEILKKGCPFNFNELEKNNCVNCNHECHCDNIVCDTLVGIGMSDKSELCGCGICDCTPKRPDWG